MLTSSEDEIPLISWGKSFSSKPNRKRIEKFLESEDDFIHPTKSLKDAFLKIRAKHTRPSVIVLRWGSEKPDPSVLSALVLVPEFVSLVKENRILARLLEIGQNSLRELSEESIEMANRNARLFQQFDSHQDRLRSISKGVIRMQEEERSKISRELHDGIGQALSALKMNLDLISSRFSTGDPAKAGALLRESQKQAEQALEDVRELSRLLRPRMLDDLGLVPTLRWYVRNFSKRSGIDLHLQLKGARHRLGRELETMIFRIIQEGLNNISKHSKATEAEVNLKLNKGVVDLEIADKGRGFDPGKLNQSNFASGSGIAGIRDRVSLVDGTFTLQSEVGTGTILKIQIPVSKKNG